ncbi:hypothetical protein GGI21_005474 [Coemansia aciculifera]|nr:hypothetical protein GGI21_005474 [Coemansia aciculifera]
MVLAALRFSPPRVAEPQIRKDLVLLARERVGPIVSLYEANIVFVDRLPKTRSGKILRKMIRMMIDAVHERNGVGEKCHADDCPIGTPATIEDLCVKMETWQTIVAAMQH